MAGVFKREPLENQPVLTWLKELHMECYGRNLEKYPTLKVRRVHGRVRHVLCSVVTKEHRGVLWLVENHACPPNYLRIGLLVASV